LVVVSNLVSPQTVFLAGSNGRGDCSSRWIDLLLSRLAGSSVRTSGIYHTTCAARHLGAAAALSERPDEARAHYQTALKVASEMRFRPEVALTRLQLAELLLEHYPDERAEALEQEVATLG